VLRALLSLPEVEEICELRGRFGVMAFHGGNLERTTDVIAAEVSRRTGASLYAVVQHAPLRRHVPSVAFDPDHSPALTRFLGRVDTVVAVHGYGREDRFRDLLLGGRNRALARHLAAHLRRELPDDYVVVDRLSGIPAGLRGLHPRNPVNLPAAAGVQLELPPTIRWHREARNWSDHDGTPRAPHVTRLIDALSDAVGSWTGAAGTRGPIVVGPRSA
jgi:phage replication-related protein YjqB (UPF0714/DUF867 family)